MRPNSQIGTITWREHATRSYACFFFLIVQRYPTLFSNDKTGKELKSYKILQTPLRFGSREAFGGNLSLGHNTPPEGRRISGLKIPLKFNGFCSHLTSTHARAKSLSSHV